MHLACEGVQFLLHTALDDLHDTDLQGLASRTSFTLLYRHVSALRLHAIPKLS